MRLAAEVAWPAAQRGSEVEALAREVAGLERHLGAAAGASRTCDPRASYACRWLVNC